MKLIIPILVSLLLVACGDDQSGDGNGPTLSDLDAGREDLRDLEQQDLPGGAGGCLADGVHLLGVGGSGAAHTRPVIGPGRDGEGRE